MFTDKFLDNLPKNPYEAAQAMCEEFFGWFNGLKRERIHIPSRYDDIVDAYVAMEVFINATGLPFPILTLKKADTANIDNILQFFRAVQTNVKKRVDGLKVEWTREKYTKRFGGVFMYEFSDGDLDTIQRLLNELREAIKISKLFEAKHKQRILKKFESLQSELHKKMSSLDSLWGLIGDAGVVLGKFGKDSKPFVDRIKEIAEITWRTQARTEELAGGTSLPLLSDGKQEDD